MNHVHAILAQVTRQAQLRLTRFWRWYRAANRRTKVAVGISTLIGVVVLSSLGVAVFRAGAHASGTSSTSGQLAAMPTATHSGAHGHGESLQPTATARATIHGHGRGHGHHTSPESGR
jgi:hypothetical protein